MRRAGTGIRTSLISYVVLLHTVLLVLVFKTNFLFLTAKTLGLIPPEEWSAGLLLNILAQADQDMSVSPGRITLVGDSIMEQLDPRLVGPEVTNFGLGGNTTRTFYAEIPVIRSVLHSPTVVLELGVNDLKYRRADEIAADYNTVLDRFSPTQTVLVLSVIPVDENALAARQRPYLRNENIAALNKEVRHVCETHANCRYLDAGSVGAKPSAYGPDGWHLSAQGNHTLADVIRHAVPTAE